MRKIYILTFGILVAIIALGCSQSPGEDGGNRTAGNTAETQQATTGPTTRTTQEETTVEQKTTAEEKEQGNAGQSSEDQQRDSGQDNNDQQESGQQNQGGGGQVEITMNAPPGQQNQQAQQQGQQNLQPVTVRVTGTEGLSFTGMVGSSQGLEQVEGNVPNKYEVSFGGTAVTAAIRKRERGQGALKVEILRDGRVVASEESSSATGVVNVVWAP